MTVVLASVFCPLFFSNATIALRGAEIVFGPLYYFLVLPSALVAAGAIVLTIAQKIPGSRDNERRILFYHLVGFAMVCSFGIVDLVAKAMRELMPVQLPNLFILGVVAFGSMIFLIFTERLILLVKDRQRAYSMLSEALREMDAARALRQIGESAASINHEIKNYLTGIRGSAEIIKLTEPLTDDGQKEVGIMLKAIDDLKTFSNDVLQLSRARSTKEDTEPLKVVPLLRQCLAVHFPDKRHSIIVNALNEAYTIPGDWNKLEHVFVNLIRNSFEAQANVLSIQLQANGTVLLITLYDNGVGCTVEQNANLFKAFYTTKKGKQGTGLGLPISRAVVESHGGHITAYPLNSLGSGIHGLKMNISLPHLADLQTAVARKVIVIREDKFDLGAFMQICGNVNVYPESVASVAALGKVPDFQETVVVTTSVATLDRLRDFLPPAGVGRLLLVFARDGLLYANSPVNGTISLFSEDLVVDKVTT